MHGVVVESLFKFELCSFQRWWFYLSAYLRNTKYSFIYECNDKCYLRDKHVLPIHPNKYASGFINETCFSSNIHGWWLCVCNVRHIFLDNIFVGSLTEETLILSFHLLTYIEQVLRIKELRNIIIIYYFIIIGKISKNNSNVYVYARVRKVQPRQVLEVQYIYHAYYIYKRDGKLWWY